MDDHEKLHKEMQQKYMELEYMQETIQQMNQQVSDFDNKIVEIANIKKALDDLVEQKDETEILVPISNGIFVKAKIQDSSKLLVNVGSDVVVQKDIKTTKTLLDDQRNKIEKYRNEIYMELMNITAQAQRVQNDLKNIQSSHKH